MIESDLTLKASPYTIVVIKADGTVAGRVQAMTPSVYTSYTHQQPSPPMINISDDRVYYADGNTSIKYLQRDGTTGTAMPYPGGPTVAAGFAVSPDNKRIAIATLAYHSPTDMHPALHLYVEDLGGGHRVELLTTSTIAEWPVAWSAGHLVIAVGPAQVPNGAGNPYNAFAGYHIADPATGKRLVTMRDECTFGPLQAAGSACWSSQRLGVQGFDGAYRQMLVNDGQSYTLALSPDGSQVAGAVPAAGAPIFLFRTTGYSTLLEANSKQPLSGWPTGWIDNQHLVFYKPGSLTRGIVDVTTGTVVSLPACAECGRNGRGTFFGALPATA